MLANDLEQITVKRLRNRLTLVRKRMWRKRRYLEANKNKMDPRRLERWVKSIVRDEKEMLMMKKWIQIALRHNGVFTYRARKEG